MNKINYFSRIYFDYLLLVREVSRMIGYKNKKNDEKILKFKKKHNISWKIIDKDGKIIEEFY